MKRGILTTTLVITFLTGLFLFWGCDQDGFYSYSDPISDKGLEEIPDDPILDQNDEFDNGTPNKKEILEEDPDNDPSQEYLEGLPEDESAVPRADGTGAFSWGDNTNAYGAYSTAGGQNSIANDYHAVIPS